MFYSSREVSSHKYKKFPFFISIKTSLLCNVPTEEVYKIYSRLCKKIEIWKSTPAETCETLNYKTAHFTSSTSAFIFEALSFFNSFFLFNLSSSAVHNIQ